MNSLNPEIRPRREFIKLSALAALALALPKTSSAILKKLSPEEVMNMSPIQVLKENQFQSLDFNGDNIDRPHDILWDIDNYLAKKGGTPNPSEFRKAVVIGGGMSGLISAHELIDYDPIVLEQDKYFGGNSKGETYKDATYSIGAAYITIPDEGSDIDSFLKDIKLFESLKHEKAEDTTFTFKNKMMRDFWQGATDPENKAEFIKVDNELKRIYNEAYPDIPWTKDSAISYEDYLYLDTITFEEWLKKTFGKVHPHIAEYFQLYCWSSFNGSIEELSALQVLNFIAAEVDGILALPGGNSAITQRLFDILNEKTTPGSLRAGAFVLRVQKKSNGKIWTTYEDAQGVVKTIESEACVVASPKYVAKYIIPDLPSDQVRLIDAVSYRGYVVANAIFNKPVTSPGFDVYCFTGEKPEDPGALQPPKIAFSDVCFGTWAQDDKAQNGVLTVYRALPYDGARQFLFNPVAHEKNLKVVRDELQNFTKAMGLDFKDLKGMRMTRWGHSIPIARRGLIQSGHLEKMNKAVSGKIFFANQDNWANPAFECSFAAAREASALVKAIVG